MTSTLAQFVLNRARRRWMKRILLVEGYAAIRETLQAVLVAEQYEAICAEAALVAIATATNYRPDLILLELNPPGQDGGWSYE